MESNSLLLSRKIQFRDWIIIWSSLQLDQLEFSKLHVPWTLLCISIRIWICAWLWLCSYSRPPSTSWRKNIDSIYCSSLKKLSLEVYTWTEVWHLWNGGKPETDIKVFRQWETFQSTCELSQCDPFRLASNLGWWHSKLDEQSTLLRLQHRLIKVQCTSCCCYRIGEARCAKSLLLYVKAMAFVLARHMRHVCVGMSHNGQAVRWSRSLKTFAYLRNKSYLTQRAAVQSRPLPLCVKALNSGKIIYYHNISCHDISTGIHHVSETCVRTE